MSSPDYLRGRRSPGRASYRLMALLPPRYELLSGACRNQTGNRGPPRTVEAQGLDGFQASASERNRFEGWVNPFRAAFCGSDGFRTENTARIGRVSYVPCTESNLRRDWDSKA